jgi:hypothetical protein
MDMAANRCDGRRHGRYGSRAGSLQSESGQIAEWRVSMGVYQTVVVGTDGSDTSFAQLIGQPR